MITLGDKVKDIVTGFEGIAIAKVEYIHGCCRYEVQPEKLYEGKPIDSIFIDSRQLKVTKSSEVKIKKQGREGSGNTPHMKFPVR